MKTGKKDPLNVDIRFTGSRECELSYKVAREAWGDAKEAVLRLQITDGVLSAELTPCQWVWIKLFETPRSKKPFDYLAFALEIRRKPGTQDRKSAYVCYSLGSDRVEASDQIVLTKEIGIVSAESVVWPVEEKENRRGIVYGVETNRSDERVTLDRKRIMLDGKQYTCRIVRDSENRPESLPSSFPASHEILDIQRGPPTKRAARPARAHGSEGETHQLRERPKRDPCLARPSLKRREIDATTSARSQVLRRRKASLQERDCADLHLASEDSIAPSNEVVNSAAAFDAHIAATGSTTDLSSSLGLPTSVKIPVADSTDFRLNHKDLRSQLDTIRCSITSIVRDELIREGKHESLAIFTPAQFRSHGLKILYSDLLGMHSPISHEKEICDNASAQNLVEALIGAFLASEVLSGNHSAQTYEETFASFSRPFHLHHGLIDRQLNYLGTNFDTILRRAYFYRINEQSFADNIVAPIAEILANELASRLDNHLRPRSKDSQEPGKSSRIMRLSKTLNLNMRRAVLLRHQLSCARENYLFIWPTRGQTVDEQSMEPYPADGHNVLLPLFPGLKVHRNGKLDILLVPEVLPTTAYRTYHWATS